MSLFGSETIRLLREDWPNATMLSQEIFAILQGNVPLTQDAPATVNSPGGVVPLTLGVPAGDTQVIQFVQGGKPAGGISIGPNGPALTNSNGNSVSVTVQAPPATTPTQTTNVFPGTVLSGSGFGPYTVQIYPDGLGAPSKNVQVRQLQIDPSDSVPSGSSVLVVQTSDGAYVMQAAVWQ